MTGGPVRPIAHLDAEWARASPSSAREHTIRGAHRHGAIVGRQPGYALAADAALDCGLVTYALGAAPGDARVWVARAAYALGEVFRLRGTAPGLQSIVVTGQDGDLQAMASSSVDDSLTSSSRGLLGMYTHSWRETGTSPSGPRASSTTPGPTLLGAAVGGRHDR